MTERRYDKDGEAIEEIEPTETLSQMLDRKRADALQAEAEAERADRLDALGEQLKRPVTGRDLRRKVGGETTGAIDRFFSNDDADLN